MCDVQGPEKVNDTCMKTMHVGTMDRGFTLYLYLFIIYLVTLFSNSDYRASNERMTSEL
jgi:Tfp pilus assembly protein PilX